MSFPSSSCRYRPISSLSPGPQQVSFRGVIANITSYATDSKSPQAAKGCLKLLVRDKTGEILVKLWYADKAHKDLQLGRKLGIATTHISSSATVGMSIDMIQALPASLTTSIFPEKDSGCGVEIMNGSQYDDNDHASALSQRDIIGLEEIRQGPTNDDIISKILVIVLNVGTQRTVTTKLNTSFQVLDLTIIDFSCLKPLPFAKINTACLSLSSPLFSSASTFIPNQTVLLITHPRLLYGARHKIKLTLRSQVFVNPHLPETILLLNWTRCLFPSPSLAMGSKNLRKNIHCPQLSHEFKIQPQGSLVRKQFSLASFIDEIDLRHQQAATRPSYRRTVSTRPSFIGYVSVLITHLPLTELYQASQLFCGTCSKCMSEMFSNAPTVAHLCCSQTEPQSAVIVTDSGEHRGSNCSVLQSTNPINLHLSCNSRLLSGFSDETGGCYLHSKDERHNLQLTEHAMWGLTGLKREEFEAAETAIPTGEKKASSVRNSKFEPSTRDGIPLARLHWIEKQVLWSRVTLVLGWTRPFKIDDYKQINEVSNKAGTEERQGDNKVDGIVVLEVLG